MSATTTAPSTKAITGLMPLWFAIAFLLSLCFQAPNAQARAAFPLRPSA
jgi:hypothetical protein